MCLFRLKTISKFDAKLSNFNFTLLHFIAGYEIVSNPEYLCFSEKKVIDLDKPLKPGAFVDQSKIKQYTEDDFILPETPPFSWLLRKTKVSLVTVVEYSCLSPH